MSQYIFDDLRDSLCPLKLVCLFTPFKVARDEVDPVCPISELHPGPVEVGPKGFYQLHSVNFSPVNQCHAATLGA